MRRRSRGAGKAFGSCTRMIFSRFVFVSAIFGVGIDNNVPSPLRLDDRLLSLWCTLIVRSLILSIRATMRLVSSRASRHSCASLIHAHIVHWWKHRFTSECMNLVYDQAFGAKTPTYSTVLQLDRKLRGFTVPPSLQIAGFGNSESRVGNYYESVPLILQRHLVLAIRESSE